MLCKYQAGIQQPGSNSSMSCVHVLHDSTGVFLAFRGHAAKQCVLQDDEEHQKLQEQLSKMETAMAEREQQASGSHMTRSDPLSVGETYRLHVQADEVGSFCAVLLLSHC